MLSSHEYLASLAMAPAPRSPSSEKGTAPYPMRFDHRKPADDQRTNGRGRPRALCPHLCPQFDFLCFAPFRLQHEAGEATSVRRGTGSPGRPRGMARESNRWGTERLVVVVPRGRRPRPPAQAQLRHCTVPSQGPSRFDLSTAPLGRSRSGRSIEAPKFFVRTQRQECRSLLIGLRSDVSFDLWQQERLCWRFFTFAVDFPGNRADDAIVVTIWFTLRRRTFVFEQAA